MNIKAHLITLVLISAFSFAGYSPAFGQYRQLPKLNSENYSFSKNVILRDKKVVEEKKISLNDYVKSFNGGYSKVYLSTLAAVSRLKIGISSFDSSRGEIRAKLINGKELFIVIRSSEQENTHVRITPANGIYDIDDDIPREIFKNINIELARK